MFILTIDTAFTHCTVALIHHTSVVARISERMNKNHAEKLIEQIAQIIHNANITLNQINRIAVNIGPGSFTGVRVGVSTAKALALALEIPAIGISSLEALAAQALQQAPNEDTLSAVAVIIEAGRGIFYHQNFNKDLTALSEPSLKTLEHIIADLPPQTILTGSATNTVALHIQNQNDKTNTVIISDQVACETADIAIYAHLASNKQPQASPRPLYLRDADAKQQTNFALPRKNNG
ncbi:tRNA threonylcarbamoyl adenosine modification protein YeaZ [Bartonella bacilliformis str. Heidi Mejia]|uniref:Glycoprotease family protein n=2 Tax=Bartonella bacilliformis TaxID=774 RepID=A1UU37_BARBK|nr:tRNA (adenosine(37)-N6)-threonylcarbamoyltransferase complex dimerization subunit type 1 TsaB [Bartonella bacilliformis]ABM45248.1 glycoprotease family protein [Bartonella bacilliformis KC583]AMG86220.1 tRNA (adenosine(37)-N6)-threonylcarbamoyltransferase complex dimerization subunit type 1 TsaB [Bartonella bacilliformis]EKS43124.1 glycoprotease family protein [Bartonella bacilliformis INS]EYS88988.1 tRNA threonylcarbamoyl adenosine modification protein YeaZ [Bartonella bacilliformis San Ped